MSFPWMDGARYPDVETLGALLTLVTMETTFADVG